MQISFICPSRNNLKYLQWSFESIIKNKGGHTVEFCVWDDFSDDGTLEWCKSKESVEGEGVTFQWGRNHGPKRLGLTILYDKIVRELATNDLCIIWHADMYLCPGALDAIEKLMYQQIDASQNPQVPYIPLLITNPGGSNNFPPIKKRIVSLTRIEPPLHPPGPEKVVKDFGTEPENFDEVQLLQFSNRFSDEIRLHGHRVDKNLDAKFCTKGVFAPWAFWKDEFLEIGGHDSLFAPQTKEDSDVWNRLLLNGTKFLQTWEGFVYHMTCRGSRFNPTLTTPGKNSDEWEKQNIKSVRNFIRKWGTTPLHDEYLHPTVLPKYNIVIVLTNSNTNLLYNLEPWCDLITVDLEQDIIDRYIEFEQPNTKYNLSTRIKTLNTTIQIPEIVVQIDGSRFNQEDMDIITQLSRILPTAEPGEFELGRFKINIRTLNTYEKDLIVCRNEN